MKLTTAIVDDDKIFHFLMGIMLKDALISEAPICLDEGKQFLNWWREEKNPDGSFLIFLDLNMPLVDGWQVLETLREEDAKNIFVVIITSSIDPKDKEKAKAYPMVIDFLVKPILMQNLIDLKTSSAISHFFQG